MIIETSDGVTFSAGYVLGPTGAIGVQGPIGFSTGAIYYLNNDIDSSSYTGLTGSTGGITGSTGLYSGAPKDMNRIISVNNFIPTILVNSLANNETKMIQSFLTPVGDPNVIVLPAGNWSYGVYASISNPNIVTFVYCHLYIYFADNTKIPLPQSASIPILTSVPALYQFTSPVLYQPLSSTDRFYVEIYATTVTANDIYLYFNGVTIGQITTTLNPFFQGATGATGATGSTGAIGAQGLQGAGGQVLYLNAQDPSGTTAHFISSNPVTAPQTVHTVAIGATTHPVFADLFYRPVSQFTDQPFIVNGIWDLNIFAGVSFAHSDQSTLNYLLYIINGATAGATAGEQIVDAIDPTIIPPVTLPVNVTRITESSSYAKIIDNAINQITSSAEVDYVNLSAFTNPVLQSQIYVQNNTGATAFNVKLYYQSSATYSHIHTTLGLAGPTGPQGATGATGATGPTGATGGLNVSGTYYSDYLFWNDGTTAWAVGSTSVHIGQNAGRYGQGGVTAGAVAIGLNAGYTGQGYNSIAIGTNAGVTGFGDNSIAIGSYSGVSMGANSIQINSSGAPASGSQGAKSIILNATTTDFNCADNAIMILADGATGVTGVSGGLYISPIRGNTYTYALGYNDVTKEITYAPQNIIASGITGASTTIYPNYFNGNRITTHTFLGPTGSITFTGTVNSTMNVLLVGGGGGGGGGINTGSRAGGGGGGGEVLFLNNVSITNSTYNIVVGSGGAGGSIGAVGSTGASTTVSTIGITFRAAGGGRGGANTTQTAGPSISGSTGTSSGGGPSAVNIIASTGDLFLFNPIPSGVYYNSPYYPNSPPTMTNDYYSNNSGVGGGSNSNGAGGGGGASGPGGNGTGSNGGAGGLGVTLYIDTVARVFGGGGGGGAGQAGTVASLGGGIGGNGASTTAIATAGGINSGNGGGGGSSSQNIAGAGGSGIVIISYISNYA